MEKLKFLNLTLPKEKIFLSFFSNFFEANWSDVKEVKKSF